MNSKFKKIAVFLIAMMTMVSFSLNAFAWGGDEHKYLAEYGNEQSGLNLSVPELTLLKYASCFPDNKDYYYKTQLEFHGGEYFLSTYINLTKVALNLGNGSSDTYTYGTYITTNGVLKSDGTTVVKWSKVFEAAFVGTSYTVPTDTATLNKYKKLFVYGMALHLATDVFAHRVYEAKTYDNKTYMVNIPHNSDINKYKELYGNVLYGRNLYTILGYTEFITENGEKSSNYADKKGYNINRFSAAENIAKNLLAQYNKGGYSSGNEFSVNISGYNIGYQVKNGQYILKDGIIYINNNGKLYKVLSSGRIGNEPVEVD